ncbi:MAG: hypothetical protein R3D25_17635 [Geminicoccaceae bacterium]
MLRLTQRFLELARDATSADERTGRSTNEPGNQTIDQGDSTNEPGPGRTEQGAQLLQNKSFLTDGSLPVEGQAEPEADLAEGTRELAFGNETGCKAQMSVCGNRPSCPLAPGSSLLTAVSSRPCADNNIAGLLVRLTGVSG